MTNIFCLHEKSKKKNYIKNIFEKKSFMLESLETFQKLFSPNLNIQLITLVIVVKTPENLVKENQQT